MPIAPTDNTVNLLHRFLDVQSRRAEVIGGNIANADTIGYTAKELDFADYLKDAAAEAALPARQHNAAGKSFSNSPRIIEQTPTAIGLDGNTVDTGREMSELAQTGSNFNFGIKMLQSRLRLLRTAIREGK